MRPFREFRVWQMAHELTLDIYDVTSRFPAEERFGLTSQVRRAASSVPLNIAEGSALGDVQFRRFLRMALGSATELEYALLLARDLGYIGEEAYPSLTERLERIKKMLVTFIKRAEPSAGATGRPSRPKANGQRLTAP